MGLWHVVLISFYPDTPIEARKKAYRLFQTLDADCGGREAGIIFWKVEWNLDLRKNVHLVEISAFQDKEALRRFRGHPKHKELTDIMREIADWQVGDISL